MLLDRKGGRQGRKLLGGSGIAWTWQTAEGQRGSCRADSQATKGKAEEEQRIEGCGVFGEVALDSSRQLT
jgi:hypothetical protein